MLLALFICDDLWKIYGKPSKALTKNYADKPGPKNTITLTAKLLRKSPNRHLRIRNTEGLEIAHILSLELFVELWVHVYGNANVKSEKEIITLKDALNTDENLYITSRHENRSIHCKYDNEIKRALKQKKSRLSYGSRDRLNQVLTVLTKIKIYSPLMKDFCKKSISKIKKIQKNVMDV